ncbi:MAG: hypothetical protein LBV63_01350 [Candidatus Methanoplasma sp.]|nr:hypothetical protein [Candidatus Methanoplasma sp.]
MEERKRMAESLVGCISTAVDTDKVYEWRQKDYEYGLIMASAKNNGIDAIVTRDARGFNDSDVAVFHPRDIGKYVGSDISCGKVVL